MPAERAETAVVLAGGDPVAPGLRGLLPEGATVIAADSGLHQAKLLGIEVDVVVGDLDSVEPAALALAEAAGARVERHPTAKDETDDDEQHGFPQHHARHRPRIRAKRHAHADLAGALRHCIGHHAIDPDERQRNRQQRKR